MGHTLTIQQTRPYRLSDRVSYLMQSYNPIIPNPKQHQTRNQTTSILITDYPEHILLSREHKQWVRKPFIV